MLNEPSAISHQPSTELISNEIKFLVICCKIDPSEDDINFIRSFIAPSENVLGVQHPTADSQHLTSLAFRHGVLPLVYKTIKELSGEHTSSTLRCPLWESLLVDLKFAYLQITKQNMLKSAELLKLNKLAKEINIQLLPFKGPALAQIAYKDISLRQFSDLDILVHRKDFRVLAKKMLERGYEPLYPIETFTGDKVMFEMNNDCPFYDRRRGLAVEIHWDFFRKLALPSRKFFPWKNTQAICINGHTFETLSHETHLLYHSLHGSKHVWERLEWIVDIDRFIRAVLGLDWGKVLKMAKGMGAQKMFLLGIALSHKYFQTPLPENILSLCKNANLEPFITYVEAEFNSDDPAPEDSLVKWSKVVGLRDNMYYKALTVLEFLFRPGINERRTVILSDKLFWLYWPLRPLGMGWRFVFCRLMKLCGK